MSSPFYAKGDPGAPIDLVTQVDRTMEFWVGGNSVGTVDVPPFNPIIYHGSDPDVARIDGIDGVIVWVGTVEPNNALAGDIFADVSGESPTILSTSLNGMNVGAPFNQMLVASGDTPIVWAALSGGVIPSGMSVSSGGSVHGTPTATGSYDFTVVADNGVGFDQCNYTGTVGAAVAPTIVTTSLGSVYEGVAFSLTVDRTGSGPVVWSVLSGTLPAGLSLDAGSGTVGGTPTATGAFSFTLRATNSVGSDDQAFSGTVAGIAPTISATPLAAMWRAFAYSQTPSTVGSLPITYSVGSGSLPAGLSLNTGTGAITGTPTTVAAYSFTLHASNTYGSDDQAFTGNVLQSTPAIVETTLTAMTIDVAFSQTLTLSTGGPTITWAVTAGALPTGVSLNTTTGAVTGTPTVSGAYSVTIAASNGTTSDSQVFTGTVATFGVNYVGAGTSSATAVAPTAGVASTVNGPNANVGDVIVLWVTSLGSGTVTAQYNGHDMTPRGSRGFYSSAFKTECFTYRVVGGEAGVKIIGVTPSNGNNIRFQSYAYSGVVTVGTLAGNDSSGTALTQTVTTAASVDDMIAHCFANYGPVLTAYRTSEGQVQLLNQSDLFGVFNIATVYGDAPGGASRIFSASTSSGNGWATLALPLKAT